MKKILLLCTAFALFSCSLLPYQKKWEIDLPGVWLANVGDNELNVTITTIGDSISADRIILPKKRSEHGLIFGEIKKFPVLKGFKAENDSIFLFDDTQQCVLKGIQHNESLNTLYLDGSEYYPLIFTKVQ